MSDTPFFLYFCSELHFALKMRRKLFISVCFAALTTLPAAAATWFMGFEGGYNYNDYNIETNYAYDMRYKGAGGITVGIPMQLDVVDWFALRMDLQYVQKNHKMYRTHAYKSIYTDTHDHYLQLPILLDFSFGGEKVRGYVGVGGYVGCWAASHREGTALSITTDGLKNYMFDEYRKLDKRHNSRFDAGLAGNLGIRLKIDDRMAFHAETDFYYGLVSTEKTKGLVAPNPRYNTTYTVLIGITFAIGRNTHTEHKKSARR